MSEVIGKGVVEVFFEPAKASLASLQSGLVGKLKGIGGVGGLALTAGIGGAIAGAKGLYEVGKTFEDVRNTIIRTTGESGKALKQLQSDAYAVGKNTPSSFNDIATAVAQLHARTGAVGKPLQDMSRNILNLSRITGTSLTDNIAAASRMFHDWKINTDDQAGALDKVYVAAQKTGVNVTTLMQEVVKFGSPLRQLGFTFDQTTALFASFEQAGVNIQTAMPGLRMGLKNIIRLQQNDSANKTLAAQAQETLNKAIKEYGKNSPEASVAAGKLAAANQNLYFSSMVAGKSIPQALSYVIKSIKNTGSSAEANSEAMTFFGTRAGPDLAAAIREGHFALGGLIKQLDNSKGALDSADKRTRTFGESWQVIKNNMLLALRPMGEAVNHFVVGSMDKLAEAAPHMAEAFGRGMHQIAQLFRSTGIGGAFSQMGKALKQIAPDIRPILPLLKLLGKAVAFELVNQLTGALKAVADGVAGLAHVIHGMVKLVDDVVHGRWKQAWHDLGEVVKGAFQILGGIIEGAMGGVVSAKARAGALKVVHAIGDAFGAVKGVISKAFHTLAGLVSAGWGKVASSTSGAFGKVKSAAVGGWNAVKGATSAGVKVVANLAGGLWNRVKAAWARDWGVLKRLVSAGWDVLNKLTGGRANGILHFLQGFWNREKQGWVNIWNTTKRIVTAGWDFLKRAWNTATGALGHAASTFWNREKQGWSNIFDTVKHLTTGFWGWVKSTWNGALHAVEHALSSAGNTLKSNFNSVYNALKGIANKLESIFKSSLPNAIRAGVNAMGSAWDKIKGLFSGPVDWVIHNVIDRLVSAVQHVLSWLGVGGGGGGNGAGPTGSNFKGVGKHGAPGAKTFRRKKASGGVLPGYTPGRDVHSFYSPTAGYLDLSGGEGIARPEVVAAMGTDRFNGLNAAARSGGIAGVQAMLGSFSVGGIVDKLKGAAKSVVGKAGGFVKGALGKAKSALGSIAHLLNPIHAIKAGFDKVMGVIAGSLGNVPGGRLGHQLAAGAFHKLSGAAKNVVDNAIKSAIDRIKSAFQAAKSAVSSFVGSGKISSGTAGAEQRYALAQFKRLGWSKSQLRYLIQLWNQESGWSPNAVNPKSGAYGIPQALPGSKIPGYPHASAKQQIDWGLGYIRSRYGSPANAWAHEVSHGWYDRGGIARGAGLLAKLTQRPERVLSPQQTSMFERLVGWLTTHNGGGRGWFQGMGEGGGGRGWFHQYMQYERQHRDRQAGGDGGWGRLGTIFDGQNKARETVAAKTRALMKNHHGQDHKQRHNLHHDDRHGHQQRHTMIQELRKIAKGKGKGKKGRGGAGHHHHGHGHGHGGHGGGHGHAHHGHRHHHLGTGGAGGRARPVTGGRITQGLHDQYTGFSAIDIGVPTGTAVRSAVSGVVKTVKHLATSYGNHIIVAGKHVSTLYAHLSKTLVHVGEHVRAGQLIGRSGSTGNATGPHLHFGVKGASPYSFLGGSTRQTAGGGGGRHHGGGHHHGGRHHAHHAGRHHVGHHAGGHHATHAAHHRPRHHGPSVKAPGIAGGGGSSGGGTTAGDGGVSFPTEFEITITNWDEGTGYMRAIADEEIQQESSQSSTVASMSSSSSSSKRFW